MKNTIANTPVSSDLLMITLLLCGTASAAEPTRSDRPNAVELNIARLEEVVVTAQRREERLQEVPIAISVLGGERLDASRASGVLEELSTVPSVATVAQPDGRSYIVIRGVAPQIAGVSPVGFYYDMVPVSFLTIALVPDANVYDLQRVEVLKGPQGTGYGIGSSTGVVRALTNDPDASKLEAKGRVSVSSTQGGKTNYLADAAFNAPIVDGRLAIRGVVGQENWGGWIDRPNKQDANDGDATSIRLKIGGEIVDGLNTVASLWHSKRRNGHAAADDNGNRNVPYEEYGTSSMDLYSFVLRKDFGAFSLVSSTSYLDLDQTAFKQSIFTPPNVQNNFWWHRSVAEEINLTSNSAGPLKWSTGLFYRSIEERNALKPTSPLATINTVSFNYDERAAADSYAAFGEMSYSLSKFEILAGLRYSKEMRTARSGLPNINYADEGSFNKVTPRVVLSWKPNQNVLTYLSYAEGFRSGVMQTQASFSQGFTQPAKSDLLRNYELGNKATVFGGMLSWEAAVYYLDWQDVQQNLTYPLGGSFVAAFLNAGSASGFGGEVSVTLRPTESFQIVGSYSQNNLEVDEDVLSRGVVLFHQGDRLALSPKSTYSAFADYMTPVRDDLEFTIGANVSSYSTQYLRFLLGVVTDIPSPAITTAGLNVGISHQDGSWRASLFVDNLTNENDALSNNYAAATPPIGNVDDGLRPRPRTVGVQFEVKF